MFTKLQQLPGRSSPRFFCQKPEKLRTSDTVEGAAKHELLTHVGRSFDVRVLCVTWLSHTRFNVAWAVKILLFFKFVGLRVGRRQCSVSSGAGTGSQNLALLNVEVWMELKYDNI